MLAAALDSHTAASFTFSVPKPHSPARKLCNAGEYQNFTIVLRVSVTRLVMTAGPPL